MGRHAHICLLADYNAWMNANLYEAASKLSPEDLVADRHAFFKSILGTLNHLVVGDTLWLKRFAANLAGCTALEQIEALPTPSGLNAMVCADLTAWRARRQMIDTTIVTWVKELKEADFERVIRYANTKGEYFERNLHLLLTHMFNHQTHHRGQVTTLLTQAGVDVGLTDLLTLIPSSTDRA